MLASHHDPLDLVLGEPLLGAVVEFGGARAFVRRHRLRMLKRAAIGQIRRDPGRPERVAAGGGGECVGNL